MYKVLVSKRVKAVEKTERLQEKYRSFGVSFEFDDITKENVSDVNILVARGLTTEILDEAKVLEKIFVSMTGLDGFPEKEIADRNIEIINTHAKAKYIAEHTFAILLDVMGKVSKTDKIFRTESMWANRGYTELWTSLFDKKVGFYGFGAIGKAFVSFCAPFNCEICTLSRQKTRGGADKYFDTLEELAEYCDVLVVSTPLTKETEGSVNSEVLKKLGGFVVNVGRGAIIDEKALYDALKVGDIKGFGSDVWYNYPQGKEPMKPSNFPFEELDNVVMSPHTAWSTEEEPDALIDDIFEQLDKFLEEKFL